MQLAKRLCQCLLALQGARDLDIEYGGKPPTAAAAALLAKVWASGTALASPQDVFGQLFAMAAAYRKMETGLGSQVTQVCCASYGLVLLLAE
jgi:hypothetical protein